MALINYLVPVQFDCGAIKLLKAECDRIGIRRPLIVTDSGVRSAGVLQRALDALEDLPHSVFDQTPSNPTENTVLAGATLYRDAACDGLLAVGGGSAIDCAKGVAIAATHDNALVHYATIEGGADLAAKSRVVLLLQSEMDANLVFILGIFCQRQLFVTRN